MLSERAHALTFRQVLTNQFVGVLVGAALPRVMRGGEVEAGGGLLFDRSVAVELGPIIDGDGVGASPRARSSRTVRRLVASIVRSASFPIIV